MLYLDGDHGATSLGFALSCRQQWQSTRKVQDGILGKEGKDQKLLPLCWKSISMWAGGFFSSVSTVGSSRSHMCPCAVLLTGWEPGEVRCHGADWLLVV